MKRSYTRYELSKALQNIGIKKGMTLFLHTNIGFFGKMEDSTCIEEYPAIFLETIQNLIGEQGTICVPTFTYSFCNAEPYDILTTASNMGVFSEYIRLHPKSIRSEDANFSIAAIGKNAEEMVKNVPEYSFGQNSFWERFLQADGMICNFNFDAGSTFVHYIEKQMCVPYRYDKEFYGKSLIQGKWEERVFYHFVRYLNKPQWDTNMSYIDHIAREYQILQSASLGRGEMNAQKSTDLFYRLKKLIEKNPFSLTLEPEERQ